jgi:hypothetical protein
MASTSPHERLLTAITTTERIDALEAEVLTLHRLIEKNGELEGIHDRLDRLALLISKLTPCPSTTKPTDQK